MAELETIRPINLPQSQEVYDNDVFVIDSETGGVRKIPKDKVMTKIDDTLTETGQAADAKKVGDELDAINDTLDENIPLIQNPTKTVSGAVAHFTDGAEMPAKSVIVSITLKQSGSGTPSPDNVRQISGWESVSVNVTGVNVWDEEVELGGLIWGDGQPLPANDRLRSKNFTPCAPNTSYHVFNARAGSVSIAVFFYDASQAFISYTVNIDFTTPSNAHYFKLVIQNTTSYNNDISINYPPTDTEYHAYTGTTKTINLGRTVYGGTLDVVSGVLTADKAMVTLDGTTSWSMGTISTFRWFDASMTALDANSWDIDVLSNLATKQGVGLPYCQINGNKKIRLAFESNDTNYDTVAKLQALLTQTPLTAVYKLATPQTYQLTPTEVKTLLGENNVWADAGAVEVTYRRDITIALSEIEQAIISLGANV